MNYRSYLLSIPIVIFMLSACGQDGETPTEHSSLKGTLFSFDSSDSLLNQLMKEAAEDFEGFEKEGKSSWTLALPYFRPVRDHMPEPATSASVTYWWSYFIQTADKATLSSKIDWEQMEEVYRVFPEEKDVKEQFAFLIDLQHLSYLAYQAGQDSLAIRLINDFTQFVTDSLPVSFNEETRSYDQGRDVDVMALVLDIVPDEFQEATFQGIMSDVLTSAEGYFNYHPVAKDYLLSVFDKFQQPFMASRMLSDIGKSRAARFVAAHLIGISPSLNAPGFADPLVRPRFIDGISFMEGSYMTIHGAIGVRLEHGEEDVIQIRVPKACKLVLPVIDPLRVEITANEQVIWGNGVPRPTPEGSKFVDINKDGVYIALNRGKYTFTIKE
ncbi:MAG: alpha-L-rhamnosidase C-terminal domain-containing protein [Bacteroidota bacterium]